MQFLASPAINLSSVYFERERQSFSQSRIASMVLALGRTETSSPWNNCHPIDEIFLSSSRTPNGWSIQEAVRSNISPLQPIHWSLFAYSLHSSLCRTRALNWEACKAFCFIDGLSSDWNQVPLFFAHVLALRHLVLGWREECLLIFAEALLLFLACALKTSKFAPKFV